MPIPAFSPAWALAFRDAVNGDSQYRDAAKSWTNPVALIVEPGELTPDGAAVQVDLAAGVCLAASAIAPADVSAPFVLSADLDTWKDIVDGGSDPLTAVAIGKVPAHARLARHADGALTRGTRAARECQGNRYALALTNLLPHTEAQRHRDCWEKLDAKTPGLIGFREQLLFQITCDLRIALILNCL